VRPAAFAQSEIPLPRPLADLLSGLLDRSPGGASLRLALLTAAAAGYWFALTWMAGFPVVLPPEWTVGLPFPLNPIVDLAASFAAPPVLVHLLPAVAGVWLGLRVASHYLADLFELEDFATASRYLSASVLSLGQEGLEIDREELEAYDASHPLVRIGGPGRVTVHLGFAAVFETAGGELRIYGPQPQVPLTGFERLRAVIDLRDQLRELAEVRAVTRDGVEVIARQAQMVFRVYSGGRPRGLQDPYPFTEESIRRLVYGQPVTENGPQKWTEALPSLLEREIQTFIAGLTLEEFLALQMDPVSLESAMAEAPQQEPGIHIPARRLAEMLQTESARQRLREDGLELAWVSVGSWEIPDPSPAAAGTGVARSLVHAWRDVERARRLRKPEVLAHLREAAARQHESQTLREILETWHGELRSHGPARCWSVLRFLVRRFPPARGDPSQPPGPPGYEAALAHLRRLTEPEIGGGPAA